MFLARHLPPRVLHALARFAGSLGWWLAPARRAIALENARHLMPGQTALQQRDAARRLLPNLFEAAVDLFRLPSMGATGVRDLVEVHGEDHLRAAFNLGRGVVIVTGHVGPYELGAVWMAAMGFPIYAMVEDLAPETGAALATYRTATGVKLVSRNTGARQLYRVLKEGNLVALVADRLVGTGAPGIPVPFGDAPRDIPTGPAAFAIAANAPVVVGSIVRRPGAGPRYRLTFEPPVEPAGYTTDTLVRRIGSQLASFAQSHPDEWYVFQPAWPARDIR